MGFIVEFKVELRDWDEVKPDAVSDPCERVCVGPFARPPIVALTTLCVG